MAPGSAALRTPLLLLGQQHLWASGPAPQFLPVDAVGRGHSHVVPPCVSSLCGRDSAPVVWLSEVICPGMHVGAKP